MGRKRKHITVSISGLADKIALWELMGLNDHAEGLRDYFDSAIPESEIEKHKAIYAENDSELAANYVPKVSEEPPRKKRKTGKFIEIKSIKNRSGDGGKSYLWRYEVTYEDGKRVKTKSLGRVKRMRRKQ